MQLHRDLDLGMPPATFRLILSIFIEKANASCDSRLGKRKTCIITITTTVTITITNTIQSLVGSDREQHSLDKDCPRWL
jgi:hypothetical protein